MCALLLGTDSLPPNPGRRGPATLVSLGDERFLVDPGLGRRRPTRPGWREAVRLAAVVKQLALVEVTHGLTASVEK